MPFAKTRFLRPSSAWVLAKEMADAALKEANAQGLTPEAGGEALRIVGDTVAQVVGSSQSEQKRGGTDLNSTSGRTGKKK